MEKKLTLECSTSGCEETKTEWIKDVIKSIAYCIIEVVMSWISKRWERFCEFKYPDHRSIREDMFDRGLWY